MSCMSSKADLPLEQTLMNGPDARRATGLTAQRNSLSQADWAAPGHPGSMKAWNPQPTPP